MAYTRVGLLATALRYPLFIKQQEGVRKTLKEKQLPQG